MTATLREQITLAVLDRLTGVMGLPAPVRDVDQPATDDYVAVDASTTDFHFLALLDEEDPKDRGDPPLLGGTAPVYEWDFTLTAAYVVRSDDATVRRDQREAGIAAICEAVLPGAVPDDLGGLAVLVRIDPYERRDDMMDGNVPLAVARVPIVIWFSAANPSA